MARQVKMFSCAFMNHVISCIAYIEVQDQVEIWRPHFWPYFLNYTFFERTNLIRNAIHYISEKNGYDSQHLDHDHGNALKTRHVFSAEFKSVKKLYMF